MNKNYHLKQTWDNKYNQTNFQKYQWIESDSIAYKLIKPLLPQDKQCQILQLGCGTSHLAEIINKSGGYKNITCIDFSKRLITKKKQKNAQQIKYICADFTQEWKFIDKEIKYDLIIDKGSIDCVYCDDNYLKRVLTCVSECYQRLNSGGRLVSFSLGLPKNRVYWLRNKLAPFIEVQVKKEVNKAREELRKKGKNYNKDKEDNSEDYFVYICKKGEGNDQQAQGDDNNMQGVDFGDDNNNDQNDNNQQQQQQQQQQENNTKNQNDKQEDNDNKQNQSDENNQNQQEEEEEEENYQNQFDDDDNNQQQQQKGN